jgi:hypothetical protein
MSADPCIATSSVKLSRFERDPKFVCFQTKASSWSSPKSGSNLNRPVFHACSPPTHVGVAATMYSRFWHEPDALRTVPKSALDCASREGCHISAWEGQRCGPKACKYRAATMVRHRTMQHHRSGHASVQATSKCILNHRIKHLHFSSL